MVYFLSCASLALGVKALKLRETSRKSRNAGKESIVIAADAGDIGCSGETLSRAQKLHLKAHTVHVSLPRPRAFLPERFLVFFPARVPPISLIHQKI